MSYYRTKYITDNDFAKARVRHERAKLEYSLAGGERRRHAFESRRADFPESHVGAKAPKSD